MGRNKPSISGEIKHKVNKKVLLGILWVEVEFSTVEQN